MTSFSSRARSMVQSSVSDALLPSWMQPQLAAEVARDMAILNGWEKRPMATYAYCFCELR